MINYRMTLYGGYINQTNLEYGSRDIELVWRTFFDIVLRKCQELPNAENGGVFNRKYPIPIKLLNFSPEHPLTKAILYIYSMETFIPGTLMVANRQKNQEIMKRLGPFAVFLSEIIYISQKSRKTNLDQIISLRPQFDAYLGCSVPTSWLQIHNLFQENTYVMNQDILCASLNEDFAINQAMTLTNTRNLDGPMD